MRIVHCLLVALIGLLKVGPVAAQALDGAAIVADRCVSCHNITGPAPTTFEGVLNRSAPDLFYAGSKFNRPWLVEWVQSPTLIRSAGVMFLRHIVNEDGKDRIDQETVRPCPSNLRPEEAEAVADYLMTLEDPAMETGRVDPAESFRESRAYNMFTKQMPCIGCHTIGFRRRTVGGISGPNLTNAGERLNPDWIYARIEDPQYWDPMTWMPQIEMSHGKRELLTLFLASMK